MNGMSFIYISPPLSWFQVWRSERKIDFHLGGGCTAAVARVILYHTLLEYKEGTRQIVDLVVVTGQGHHSGNRQFQDDAAPVLKGIHPSCLVYH